MDTPVTSGSDLISNPGNANLGYSSGVGYGANPAVTNPLEGVDNTLARIQQQDSAMRMQRHLEQRQDIEGLSQMLAQTNGSLFNMKDAQGNNVSFTPLPGDKKQLDEQADRIRKIVLNKPENYKNDPDFYKAKQELDYMTRHASVRSAFATQENQLASGEQNPDERNGRLSNMNEQINSNLTDYKMPSPYKEGPKFKDELADPKLWQDPSKLQHFGTENVTRADGTAYEVSKSGIPTNELLKPINDVSSAGMTNAKNAATLWLHSPEAQNAGFIKQMDQQIVDNAKQRGIDPVFAAIVNPDGSIQYNPNPGQILAAHNLYSYGALRSEEKPSDAGIKQEAEKANIAHTKAQIADMKDKNDIAWYNAKKDDKPKYEATNTALKVADTFLSGREGTQKPIDIKITPDLLQAANSSGINYKNFTISKGNANDQNIKEIIGAPKYDESGKLQSGDYESPEEVYHLVSKDGIENDKFAAKVPIYRKVKSEKKGVKSEGIEKVGTQWVFVSPQEAVSNKIRYTARNINNIQVPQAIENAVNTLNDAFSGKKPEASQATDDEATVKARLKPITITKKDGTTIKALIDPVTNKKYAAAE